MIHIYNSHSLDRLAQQISGSFKEKTAAPLTPTWVIVQNNEIKEWLSLKLARQQGIAANLKFIFPSEFLWTLYRLKRREIPTSLPSDLNSMHWTLFELFSKEPRLLESVPVYDHGSDTAQKRFQFSGQLADLFDQYQVYRPEMMESWLQQKLVTKQKDEQWQSAIWKKLNERWNSIEEIKSIPSRSMVYKDLINWLEDEDNSFTSKLPRELYVFGLSHLNQPFLEIVTRISLKSEVHFYKCDLRPELQNEALNELMTDWNSSAKEQEGLLKQILENSSTKVFTHDLDDENISRMPALSLHSCHNARREVEVVKDRVLAHLDDYSDVRASDILIMVPDADEYAPLIENIFSGNGKEPALPVSHLSGKTNTGEYALLKLLDILNTSFKPSDVLELMNLESIKSTFSFTDDDLNRLEELIVDSKVHRGLGDQFNAPYTWQKGVNQLISGFVMEPGELELYKDLVPYEGVYAKDDMMLISRFSAFLHALKEAEENSRSAKTPLEWLDFTADLINRLLSGDAEKRELAGLFSKLTKLKEQLDYSGTDEEISFILMKSWLKTRFITSDSSSGRFGQGITVSSYVPYRSVPFKFIAILGLNEGVFPRKAVQPEFDLIYSDPKPGDRIQKEDDTYLFLETLCATDKHLHISYRGQDHRSDEKRLPSMLVQQLWDVLGDKLKVTEHKLHAFNKSYFSKEHDQNSYSSLNLEIAESLLMKRDLAPVFISLDFKQPEQGKTDEIDINDLIYFFTNTSKYLLHNYLNISDRTDHNEITDRESFDLDNLESYSLDNFIDASLSGHHSKAKVFDYIRASAMVPDKLKGKKVFEDEYEQIISLREQIGSITKEEEQILDIDIVIGGRRLAGKIPGVFGDILVTHRVGKRKPKYEIGHWLKHLILAESGFLIQKSVFISNEKSDVEVLEISTSDIPKNTLSNYLEWFLAVTPLLSKASFFPKTSKKYAEEFMTNGDKEKALFKARRAWEPAYGNPYVESNEYFNQVLWRNRDPLVHDSFHANAIRFWNPYLKASGEGE